jgi:hypothetical protein
MKAAHKRGGRNFIFFNLPSAAAVVVPIAAAVVAVVVMRRLELEKMKWMMACSSPSSARRVGTC